MDNVKHLPEPKRLLLQQLTDQLRGVAGMAAIVLGGSYASGTQHEASDLDLGLYYRQERPFSIASIRQAPLTMLTMYGMTTGAGEQLMVRYFGAALLGQGVLSWLARNSTDASVRRALILGMLIHASAGLVVSLLGTLTGVMSPVGWSTVAIYLVLGLGFGYLLFVHRDLAQ